MTISRMMFTLLSLAIVVDVVAMQERPKKGKPNCHTTQFSHEEVLDTVRTALERMSLNPDHAGDLLLLLKKQGLRIGSTPGEKVRVKDVATETDPIIEYLYEPVFARSFPSTERKTEEKLLEIIRNEKKGISASLYELNSYTVAYELCKKYQEGVDVRLIFDSGCHVSTALLLLQRCAVPMKFCSVSGGILHQKVFRFDANTGKKALLDKKHERDKAVLEALARRATDAADKELRDAYSAALDRPIALYWDGSFNITGVADQKNIESTTVVADDRAYSARKNEFEELWKSRRSSQKKSLEDATFKGTELTSNGVPSKNVFYLLKSAITINGHEGLSLATIMGYKDFAPRYFGGDIPDKELLPSVSLPFPCCIRIRSEDAHLEVKLNDGNWIVLKDALMRSQQLQITKYPLKLHGIAQPVNADIDNWFFKLEGTNDYYELAYLQLCKGGTECRFFGPYDEEQYGEVKTTGTSRKPRYDKSYSLTDLKVQAMRSRASLEHVLKEVQI